MIGRSAAVPQFRKLCAFPDGSRVSVSNSSSSPKVVTLQ
jgi:hypothetical protein